jgi:hypothetical protein
MVREKKNPFSSEKPAQEPWNRGVGLVAPGNTRKERVDWHLFANISVDLLKAMLIRYFQGSYGRPIRKKLNTESNSESPN